eukprot:scaffold787_cov285-Chaetoceros_neogracile.AAC.13
MGSFCSSAARHNIDHQTQINAPIAKLWAAMIDIDHWEKWNKWTTLEAIEAKAGVSGKLHACYEGDGKWEDFDFTFGEVDEVTHTMAWFGKVAGGFLFHGQHQMRLEAVSPTVTLLVHQEEFSGLLPALNAGLPYAKLRRNYLLMNEALKAHVEVIEK